jgi:hypothetical protein
MVPEQFSNLYNWFVPNMIVQEARTHSRSWTREVHSCSILGQLQVPDDTSGLIYHMRQKLDWENWIENPDQALETSLSHLRMQTANDTHPSKSATKMLMFWWVNAPNIWHWYVLLFTTVACYNTKEASITTLLELIKMPKMSHSQ